MSKAMEDETVWQWIAGVVTTAWLASIGIISNRFSKRLEKLEDGGANREAIDVRLDALEEKVDRHDDRNAKSHDKIFDELSEHKAELRSQREVMERIEGKVDILGGG